MTSLESDGGRALEILAEHDESLLEAYVADERNVSARRLREALAAQTKQALVYPVFCGSALSGAGVDPLRAGIAQLLPAATADADGPLSGTVFKIERAANGEKVAYARMFSGTLHTRDRVSFGRDGEGKLTAIAVFADGDAVQRRAVRAGEIAKLWGLREVQIGDALGDGGGRPLAHEFAPPTLESVVEPRDRGEGQRLRVSLAQLAEQDPLINVRQDDGGDELTVSLYGEVQKEVIEATLADDFGVAVTFRETTPIYIERPLAVGEAIAILNTESNPFHATIGFRVEPAPAGTGAAFRLDVAHDAVPMYVYKTRDNFAHAMEAYVRDSLRQGLYGWEVTDCIVTMTDSGYTAADGPPSRRGPLSTAADFRKLTPLVLMQALERARTVVCEPTMRVTLEVPSASVGAVLPALARLGAAVEAPSLSDAAAAIEAVLPAALVDGLQRELPRLTHGEGVLESTFAGYERVSGDPPRRRRSESGAGRPAARTPAGPGPTPRPTR